MLDLFGFLIQISFRSNSPSPHHTFSSNMNKCISILLATATSTSAFVTHQGIGGRYAVTLHAEKQVGVFFGTSTGSTEEAAELIVSEFGDVAAGPIDIDGVAGSVAKEFAKYDALVVRCVHRRTYHNVPLILSYHMMCLMPFSDIFSLTGRNTNMEHWC